MFTRTRILLVLQWLFGFYFIYVGVMHFVLPDNLPGPMEWMYELNDTMHYISGTAEILGGFGLILPWTTGIARKLTPLAAAGLAIVMLGAAVWHLTRSEFGSIGQNLVVAGVMAYLASVRWRELEEENTPR